MNALILRFIRFMSPFWERFGAEPKTLVAILEAKLTIDSRRPFFLNQQQNNSFGGKTGAVTLVSLILMFMGLVMCSMFFLFDTLSMGLFIYFTIWMVLLAMAIVTDFTEVLVDDRDNYVLLTRPLEGSTLALARLLHISIYLLKLTIAYALPALILFPIKAGILGLPLFIIQLLLSMVLVVLFVNATYLLLFRIVSPARFRDVLGYFQIGVTILFILAYYVVPRILEFDNAVSLTIYDQKVFGLLPSTWISALWDTVMEGELRVEALYYSALAILMPPLALILVLKVFAPNFDRQLLQLSFSGSSPTLKRKGISTGSFRGTFYFKWWLDRIKQPEERAAFAMSWKISGRDQDFKMRTYPMFGLLVAYFLMFALLGDGTLAEKWERFLHSKTYLMLLYLAFIPGLGLIQHCFYTKKTGRSWVYYATPIQHPGGLIRGTILAVLAKYLLPVFLMLSALILGLFGLSAVPDLVFSWGAILLALLVASHLQLRYLPFSRPISDVQQGQTIGLSFLGAIIVGMLGLVHYGITSIPVLFLAAIPFVYFCCWYSLKSFSDLKWENIQYN